MNDGFNDGFKKSDKNDLTPSNTSKIPDKKTAVALKGSEGGKKVPRIAASGRGTIADKILALAFEHDIKVREDGDLVELLAAIDLDSPIPTEAFSAVGEILSYVYHANGQENPFETLIKDDKE